MLADKSQWQETKTFFPLFLHKLAYLGNQVHSVCVVGASDGKFVIPLAEAGYSVEALDIDEIALFGGDVEFPPGKVFRMRGLKERLSDRGLSEQVAVRLVDFTDENVSISKHDAIFTSCSWHYSRNHHFPLERYVEKMQDALSAGGVFCSEYMMPVEVKHFRSNHYVKEGQLATLFPNKNWRLLEDFCTQPFVEDGHIGNSLPHVHQMGFLMAVKK